MPGRLPNHPKDISAEWLTSHMKAGGVLTSGSVTSVAVQLAQKWNHAHTARVAIEYDTHFSNDGSSRLMIWTAASCFDRRDHLGEKHFEEP